MGLAQQLREGGKIGLQFCLSWRRRRGFIGHGKIRSNVNAFQQCNGSVTASIPVDAIIPYRMRETVS
jgi:hypothetical protein